MNAIQFSPAFGRALLRTWNAIAPDLGEVDDNDDAIEACLDADRLLVYGSAEVAAELHALIKQHSHIEVFQSLSKQFHLV